MDISYIDKQHVLDISNKLMERSFKYMRSRKIIKKTMRRVINKKIVFSTFMHELFLLGTSEMIFYFGKDDVHGFEKYSMSFVFPDLDGDNFTIITDDFRSFISHVLISMQDELIRKDSLCQNLEGDARYRFSKKKMDSLIAYDYKRLFAFGRGEGVSAELFFQFIVALGVVNIDFR